MSKTFAVLGEPIAHSKSPAMHAAAYAARGLPHRYVALSTSPEQLPLRFEELREGLYAGFNVTVPLKTDAMALTDGVDPSAKAVGATNTLVPREDGRIWAYNTDAPAIADELTRLAGGTITLGGDGLVLGSGGAGRAAVAAMAQRLGARRVVVRARSFTDPIVADAFVRSMKEALRGSVGEAVDVEARALTPSPRDEAAFAYVVQATSCGMRGAAPGEIVADAVAWEALSSSAVALDVVYAPRETPFLLRAAARGLASDHGLGMLARQGALAFELWLGGPPPEAVMRAALEQLP